MAYHVTQKRSLHMEVSVEDVDILALVDTDATSCFVQQAWVWRLGLWESVRHCNQEVHYGNGDVEPMAEEVTLPVKVHGIDMPMAACVLRSKGPSFIMGFAFLKASTLLIDCTSQE